jgi:hypothetical protein
MIRVITPDLTDEATGAAIDAALEKLDAAAPAQEISPPRRRKLRELVSPQANGDQDSW